MCRWPLVPRGKDAVWQAPPAEPPGPRRGQGCLVRTGDEPAGWSTARREGEEREWVSSLRMRRGRRMVSGTLARGFRPAFDVLAMLAK